MDDPAAERSRRLAAGLAHDINNLLNAFVGYGELLRTGLAGDPDLLPYAEGIVDACRRGTRLSHQLAVLGGRVRARLQPVDLAPLVAGLAERDAEVPVDLGPLAEVQVVADPVLLAEALRLAVDHVRRCLAHGPRLHLAVPAGAAAVELHLGTALPPAAEGSVWEAFAPLRPGGRGSLMLATAKRLVELCGGTCSVAALPTGGVLRFALASVAGLPLAGRRVLVAVADEEVRQQIEDALGAAGAQVLGAASLGDAERLAAHAAAPPQALVADHSPPRSSPLADLPRLPPGSPPDVVAALAGSGPRV